jgi:uncharacterized protein
MIQTRRTVVWIFTALAGLFGVIGAALIWTSQHHQQELSVADKFYMAGRFPSTYHYEIAAEIMRPIAETGDVNAQVNLAVALNWINTRKALKENALPDRDEEFKWWCLAALQGDAEAQNHLGTALYNKNEDESTFWLKHATENGDPNAQERMAWSYRFGMGVPIDEKKAFQLLNAAAENGHDGAQLELADIYWDGRGADPPWTVARQDYAEAAKWYLAAAKRGNSIAQEKIGLMYYRGLGVVQDFGQAYFWSSLAAANANLDQVARSAREMRDEIASHLTTERINRTQETLGKWRALPSTSTFHPEWRQNPGRNINDGPRVAELPVGSACSRWHDR